MDSIRVRKVDKLNYAIERRRISRYGNERWELVSYHQGVWTMAHALCELVADSPEREDVCARLDAIISLFDERTDKICERLDELLKRADELLKRGEPFEIVLEVEG